MRKVWISIFIGISFFGYAQKNLTKDKSLNKILPLASQQEIKDRIKFLADDELRGRKPGTPGYQMAVDYVIDQFKSLGIQPKGDQGYIQNVILRTGKIDTSFVSFSLNDEELRYGKDIVVMPDMNNSENGGEAEVVFVGLGISAPHLHHDDFSGIDVNGKVVMMVSGVPEEFPAGERAHFNSMVTRAEAAARRGAVGTIAIVTREVQFRQAFGGSSSGIRGVVRKDGTVISTGLR